MSIYLAHILHWLRITAGAGTGTGAGTSAGIWYTIHNVNVAHPLAVNILFTYFNSLR